MRIFRKKIPKYFLKYSKKLKNFENILIFEKYFDNFTFFGKIMKIKIFHIFANFLKINYQNFWETSEKIKNFENILIFEKYFDNFTVFVKIMRIKIFHIFANFLKRNLIYFLKT